MLVLNRRELNADQPSANATPQPAQIVKGWLSDPVPIPTCGPLWINMVGKTPGPGPIARYPPPLQPLPLLVESRYQLTPPAALLWIFSPMSPKVVGVPSMVIPLSLKEPAVSTS